MNITKALADETRVRTLLALRQGELCVCQITELFGLAPSTVSKHLSILLHAGLVESRKEGRWIYYQLPAHPTPGPAHEVMDCVEKSLRKDRHVAEDARRIRKILKKNPTELCRKQCQR